MGAYLCCFSTNMFMFTAPYCSIFHVPSLNSEKLSWGNQEPIWLQEQESNTWSGPKETSLQGNWSLSGR